MILEALALPEHLQCRIKLRKSAFVEHARHKNATQRLLRDQVSSLHIIGHLTPDNSNIAAYKDQQHEYLELMVLQCELKDTSIRSNQLNALHRLFHQHIPYPLVVEISAPQHEQVQWSLAHKGINQADTESTLLVLNDIHATDWLNTTTPDALTYELKKQLDLNQQNHSHFLALYDSLIQHIVNYLLAVNLNRDTLQETVSSYQINNRQGEVLKQVLKLKEEIASLENKRDKSQQFNDKVALNLRIQSLKKQLKILG